MMVQIGHDKASIACSGIYCRKVAGQIVFIDFNAPATSWRPFEDCTAKSDLLMRVYKGWIIRLTVIGKVDRRIADFFPDDPHLVKGFVIELDDL